MRIKISTQSTAFTTTVLLSIKWRLKAQIQTKQNRAGLDECGGFVMIQGEWVNDGFYHPRPCHQLFHFHDKSSPSDYLTRLTLVSLLLLLFMSSPCSTPRADHSSCTSSSCPSFVLTPTPLCCGDSLSLPISPGESWICPAAAVVRQEYPIQHWSITIINQLAALWPARLLACFAVVD